MLDAYSTNTNLTLSSILSNLSLKANTTDITKALIGLGNVDNTSDLSKPISTAAQSALDTKLFTCQLTQFLANSQWLVVGYLHLNL